MIGSTTLKTPESCDAEERSAFARVLRLGFPAAMHLERRIREAQWLAFQRTTGGALVAVAALKSPSDDHRAGIFAAAAATSHVSECQLDLGWVFVDPAFRCKGIGIHLCRALMRRVPERCVFATTRSDNAAMMRILDTLGFERAGRPFRRRDEELVLFLGRWVPGDGSSPAGLTAPSQR
jgi:RimJ/RimL family protein N-acetyltransferase